MAVLAKKPENEGILAPAGTHHAVCYGVWDLGQQKSTWNGVTAPKHKCVIAWEIDVAINMEGNKFHGKRYVVSKQYTVSLGSKANLYKDLTSWRGIAFTKEELEGFDIETVVGANCFLQVIHTEGGEKTYANVETVMNVPAGTPHISPENSALPPDWVKKKQDDQYNVSMEEDVSQDPLDHAPPIPEDDLPF